jgi:hypothetical protein
LTQGGVPLEACERILTNGIDVIPTDAVIWANDLMKAAEYGRGNQLIMILNSRDMRRSYKQLDRNATSDAQKAIEKEYGVNPVIFPDGAVLYSRLAADDKRRGTPYELAHGWYIPGDPFSILSGLIICAPSMPSDQ